MNEAKFGFENLEVWQKSVEFTKAIINFTDSINALRKHYRLIEQLESAAASVALNIAEGSGRYSKKEFIRFLYIARGSLYETVALLEIFKNNRLIPDKQLVYLRANSVILAKMLSGLINSLKL